MPMSIRLEEVDLIMRRVKEYIDLRLEDIKPAEVLPIEHGGTSVSSISELKDSLGILELGIEGPAGPRGIQGPKGDKGDKGDVGDTGPIGPTGSQGPNGATGARGEIGPKGDTGATGPAFSGSAGSTTLPVYVSGGAPIAITQANLRIGFFGTSAIGAANKPVYIAANGVATACSTTVGSTTLPIYSNAGTLTALTQANLRIGTFGTAAIGAAARPVYIAANGVPTAMGTLGIANGGTNATTAAAARTQLGITPANIGAMSITGNTSMLEFANNSGGIQGTMGDNDLYRIIGRPTSSDVGYLEIATADNGDEAIYVRQYGGGGIDFITPIRQATLLDGAGNTVFPGNVRCASLTQTSDKKAKKNIQPMSENIIDLIMNMDIVEYNWNTVSSDRKHIGVIAQDLETKMAEHNISHEDYAVINKVVMATFENEKNEADRIRSVHINEYTDPITDEIVQYGINPDQILFGALAALQKEKRRNDKLEDRVKALEELVSQLVTK